LTSELTWLLDNIKRGAAKEEGKWDFDKRKSLNASKCAPNTVKRQTTEWENALKIISLIRMGLTEWLKR
jgi:hypothetical protein